MTFVSRQIPKSLDRVGVLKSLLTMKILNSEQMQSANGGRGCGKIGGAFSLIGGVLMIVALASNPVTLVGGLSLAYSISAGIVGIGCGAVELAS